MGIVMGGDEAFLLSPYHTFDSNTIVTFSMKMTKEDYDRQTRLEVLLVREDGSWGPLIESFSTSMDYTKQSLCMPPGKYALGFLVVIGLSTELGVSIDEVIVQDRSCSNPVTDNGKICLFNYHLLMITT